MKDFKSYLTETQEIGFIEEVMQYIVYVSGLPNATPHEMVVFETGEVGQIISLSKNFAEVLVFSRNQIKVGTKAARTKQFLEVAVGKELLGQTIDPLGNNLIHIKPFKKPSNYLPIDIYPSGINSRKRITKPLETGITLVDLVIPIGKGQRELVIGDRKSGKTNFIVHTVLNQAKKGVICIYGAIGKKKIDIKKIEELLIKNKVMDKVVIVASSPQDPSSIIHITPYTAMTIAEYFKDQGTETLVILDDLSTHAKFYREISLLARRFPGRNSYPGDIFHVHSKLLERAGNFITDKGEASITCLPVVETIQGDLTGYIQTNIMSMTDGHIFFDSDLFSKGRRPAINPFLSVTRVGHQTQTTLRREINRELISFLTLYEKIQNYVHFGAELSDSVKATLATGDRILHLFDQPLYKTNPANIQVFLFSTLWIGTWNEKSSPQMKTDIEKIIFLYETDKTIKDKIDMLIKSNESFNKLLGALRTLVDEIFMKISENQSRLNRDQSKTSGNPPANKEELTVTRIPVEEKS